MMRLENISDRDLDLTLAWVEKLTHLSLAALRVPVEELSDVGHDGLLVRTIHIHILRVQQLGDAQLSVSHKEGGLQPHCVAHMAHGLDVDQAWDIKMCLLSVITQ